jgi:hypothetical protein
VGGVAIASRFSVTRGWLCWQPWIMRRNSFICRKLRARWPDRVRGAPSAWKRKR